MRTKDELAENNPLALLPIGLLLLIMATMVVLGAFDGRRDLRRGKRDR